MNLSIKKKSLLYTAFTVLSTTAFLVLSNILVVAEPYRTAIVIFAASIVFSFFLKKRIEKTLTAFTVVYASSYIVHLFGIVISYPVLLPFGITEDASYDSIRFVITGIISIIIAILLTKIKVNLNHLFKKFSSGIFLSISSLIIILYGFSRVEMGESWERFALITAGFAMLGYGIYSWLRRETTISKYENANDVIHKKQQTILEQKEKDIAVLKNLQNALASTDHQNAKILDGMRRTVEKLVMRSEQADVLDDAQKFLEQLEFSKKKTDKNRNMYGGQPLPQTGIMMIDSQFETVAEKAMLKSVDFELKVHGDVSRFCETIHEVELINIIGDFAENAFIAIHNLNLNQPQPCRKVRFIIAESDDGYELTASDSGIPFNADVLLKLGTERVTSHADSGGSGYGYETIFGLLDEYKASLIITEYEPMPYDYSKDITICFDRNAECIIKSFRAKTLKKLKANTRFTIQGLEVAAK
ncbi:MAG: hypothetical protein FWF94_05065 [Oscillospiraceae bacterium]|nr:hypothetical protein [Oscillospiraceae bacterium]